MLAVPCLLYGNLLFRANFNSELFHVKQSEHVLLLILRNKDLLAAHVRLQRLRNLDGAVSLQVVLEKCYQHTRRGDNGVVQCMSEVIALLTLDADAKTACLCITEVRAAADFEILLLTRRPSLNVAGLQQDFTFRSARSPEQHSIVRTGISRERKNLTEIFQRRSYHMAESSGSQTTTISCFSN